MKTIGLIGGMSWESTVVYYQQLNRLVRERRGPLASARILLFSVNFAEFAAWQQSQAWNEAGEYLRDQAVRLQTAGADIILIGANTMHRVADTVEAALRVPLLHIADPIGIAARARGLRKMALLGTRYTMEGAFYLDRLRKKFGLEVIAPDEADKAEVHRMIYEELCAGKFLETSRAGLREIIASLAGQGAQGVILGCTELGMLLDGETAAVPCFDSALLHAEAAVDFALAV